MSAGSKTILVALVLAVSTATMVVAAPQPADLTKRQTAIGDKMAPMKTRELQMNDQFGGQRIPIKQWHAEFSPIGQRRSSIEVRERRDKEMIRPTVLQMQSIDAKMAPQSGRMAYVRNFDQVQENSLVPRYRDADVVTVQEMSTPASPEKKELSMRELNRFSFQRNHSDSGGARVDQAASEK